MVELYPHQIEAVDRLKNGSILCGEVGTGKSRAALAYFYLRVCQGSLTGKGSPEPPLAPRDLFIITTAKKRDSHEWWDELAVFQLTDDYDFNYGGINVTIDSWNNIKKYKDVTGAFFIFDEQRVVGSGMWVKTFLNISRKNQWILLTATPGDVWKDYIPVFVANGFYKNKTEFYRRHAVMNPHTKFPKIDRYVDTAHLIKLRRDILVKMQYEKDAEQRAHVIFADYNKDLYCRVMRDRWDPYDNCPIEESGKLCYLLRRVVNSDPSRLQVVINLLDNIPKAIIFYNFMYELYTLRDMLDKQGIVYSEWNGERHEEIPKEDRWVYLVQYNAGSEGWNCIETDTTIFFSQNYSYRITKQAAGRIDRLNTPYKVLNYYYIRSRAPIDEAIHRALQQKRNFNEKDFVGF